MIGVFCSFDTFERNFQYNSLTLNRDVKDSLKKFLLHFRQTEMVFVVIWFLDHFAFEYVPSMNGI